MLIAAIIIASLAWVPGFVLGWCFGFSFGVNEESARAARDGDQPC